MPNKKVTDIKNILVSFIKKCFKIRQTDLIIICIAIIVLFFLIRRDIEKSNEIKANPGFAIGKVIETGRTSKPAGYIFKYKFKVNNVIYISTERYNSFCYRMQGAYFPVIYSTKDPSNSSLLVYKSGFKYFNIPFPDSLKWVYHCERPGLFQ